MSTIDKVRTSIQKQVEMLDNLDIILTEVQLQDILIRISRLNKQIEEYAKTTYRKINLHIT